MAKYQDQYGNISEVGNPELNPELVAGKTLVPDTTPLSTSISNTPISVSNLTPATPINVPPPPTPTTPDIAGGQAMIDYFNKLYADPESKPTDLTSLYEKYLPTSGVPEAQQDVLTKQTTFKAARDKLAAINAQLAGITARAQAIPIQQQQEGIGRRSVNQVNALSNEELRKNALEALPLQAQALAAQAEVQAAQGDVELSQSTLKLAQDKLNTIFQLKTKDAENQYNYRKDLRDKVWSYATEAEKTRLAAQQKKDDQAIADWRDIKNDAQAKATALLSTQPGLAAKITARLGQTTGINDKTLQSDIAALMAQAKAKEAAAGKGPNADTTFTDKVIDGRLVRITAEKNTGKEISRVDLGNAGETTITEKKTKFIQYLAQVPSNTKTRGELEKEAMSAGLSVDNDITQAIDAVNKTSWLRKALGF